MLMTQDVLYTIDEASRILRVSHDTIRRMIKAGELDAIKVRNQWRVRKESIDKVLRG